MKSLFDVIQDNKVLLESEESERSYTFYKEALKLEKTKIPPVMATIKNHFWNHGEYELFEFMDLCDWWSANIKKFIVIINNSKVGYVDVSMDELLSGKTIPPERVPPGVTEVIWFRTASVRVSSAGRIEFAYDPEYIIEEAKEPGKLAYLMAHEASHILRFHIDRTNMAKHDHSLANTAQDMIINNDIDETPQIGGWKPVPDKGDTKIPKDFREIYKDKKDYFYENMYNYLWAQKEKQPKAPPQPPMDYYGDGQIVKIKDGPDKGKYGKITKSNPDGTFEVEAVDIDAEIEKVKKGTDLMADIEKAAGKPYAHRGRK